MSNRNKRQDTDSGHPGRKGSRKVKANKVIHSIGYEGMDLSAFVQTLKTARVEQLIDVREIPFSFKRGFSKTPLSSALSEVGIGYTHIKELGTDKRSRHEYRQTGDRDRLLDEFKEKLGNNMESYELLTSLARSQRSTIMCFEKDHNVCHRQVIEEELVDDGFEVKHLCNGKLRRP